MDQKISGENIYASIERLSAELGPMLALPSANNGSCVCDNNLIDISPSLFY